MSEQHPGFRRVSERIARRRNPRTGRPYGQERANRILGAAKARASARARRENPRLNRTGVGDGR